MRNWKGEKREAEIIRGIKKERIKEFNQQKEYLITLEDSFLELVFDETMEDSYDDMYKVFSKAYNNAVFVLNQKFGNVFENLNTYFEDNYKPISPRYERICN